MSKYRPEDQRWAVEPNSSSNCACMSKRYTIAVLSSIGFVICFGLRCNMGVAIVAMISPGKDGEGPEFDWTPETIGVVDNSFLLGYLLTPIPAGIIAARYPANKLFGTAIAVSALLNILIPGAAKLNPSWLMLVRLLQGLAEGFTYPACHGLLSHWAPPLERARLVTLVFSGSYAGAVIGLSLSSLLTEKLGWEACFYVFGILGLVWYGFWQWLSFEKPATHPTISREELVYIESSLGDELGEGKPTLCTTPWSSILLSPPVYAIIIANFCRSCTFYLILVSLPMYFSEVFQDLEFNQTILLGALPHLCMTLVVPLGGFLADQLRMSSLNISTTNVRKLFNCGGFSMEALMLILVGCIGINETFNIVGLTLAVIFSGFAISGFNVNHLDIAPRYASTLMGITSTFGTVGGLTFSIVINRMTSGKTPEEWSNLFILAGVIHICGILFYGVFGSGELQEWAVPTTNEYIQETQSEPTQV